jgi:hypothetical protein
MKPFEYFDKRVKVLLHDVSTYTLTEHREAVPAIVALTAELNDTDYRYAFEAYLKGRASCMADTVKELDGDEIGLDRLREILRNLRDEWLPQTSSDFNSMVVSAIRMSVTDEAIDNELKDRGYYE